MEEKFEKVVEWEPRDFSYKPLDVSHLLVLIFSFFVGFLVFSDIQYKLIIWIIGMLIFVIVIYLSVYKRKVYWRKIKC